MACFGNGEYFDGAYSLAYHGNGKYDGRYKVMKATSKHVSSLLYQIEKLNSYSGTSEKEGTSKDHLRNLKKLTHDLEKGYFSCVISVDNSDRDEKVIGYILYCYTYSTWEGIGRTINMQDVYVDENHRRAGLGRRMIAFLAKVCEEERIERMFWGCQGWNSDALMFYLSLGARNMTEKGGSNTLMMSKEAIAKLAKTATL